MLAINWGGGQRPFFQKNLFGGGGGGDNGWSTSTFANYGNEEEEENDVHRDNADQPSKRAHHLLRIATRN